MHCSSAETCVLGALILPAQTQCRATSVCRASSIMRTANLMCMLSAQRPSAASPHVPLAATRPWHRCSSLAAGMRTGLPSPCCLEIMSRMMAASRFCSSRSGTPQDSRRSHINVVSLEKSDSFSFLLSNYTAIGGSHIPSLPPIQPTKPSPGPPTPPPRMLCSTHRQKKVLRVYHD